MLITIIIPVYNVEKYLEECLESVCNQIYQNLEILLINCGSTDRSLEICKKYAAKDHRIRIISQKNNSLCAARNTGLKQATGEYILFVNGTDYIEEYLVELLMLDMVQGFDLIMFNFWHGNQERNIGLRDGVTLRGTNIFKEFSKFHQDVSYITSWQYCYKREFLEKNHIRYCVGLTYEDEIWTRQVLALAEHLVFRNINGYHARIQENSFATDEKLQKKCKSYFKIAEELNFFIQERELPGEQVELFLFVINEFIVMAMEMYQNLKRWERVFPIQGYLELYRRGKNDILDRRYDKSRQSLSQNRKRII